MAEQACLSYLVATYGKINKPAQLNSNVQQSEHAYTESLDFLWIYCHSPYNMDFRYTQNPGRDWWCLKTATGMAHFSIMWQGPPTMADKAFPGG